MAFGDGNSYEAYCVEGAIVIIDLHHLKNGRSLMIGVTFYEKVRRNVTHLIDQSPDSLAGCETAFSDLFSRELLTNLLGDILDNELLLTDIAKNSYVHGNGFDKVVLFTGPGNSYKVRLHIWWPGLNSEENIHDHRWDFCSTIISGGILFEKYMVSKDGFPVREFVYKDRGSDYELVPIGLTRLEKVFSGYLSQKSHYFLSHIVPHRIYPFKDVISSTVILQNKAVRDWTRLFTNRVVDYSQTISTVGFKIDDLSDRLEKYLFYLEKDTPGAESA
jgi:hypothetical protein